MALLNWQMLKNLL